jgi:very-short-patch-repair endonuclease
LFELNVKPGFDFAGRPAEIDLACLSKRIAVEIDGYHHFTDPAGYRRDRRKDVLLQKHGFFVLRFLAEDVVSEMEVICESIRAVVEWRG